ncbi:MAG: NapC/NirT family cytochrome c, partial [Phycisphaerales bacterium]
MIEQDDKKDGAQSLVPPAADGSDANPTPDGPSGKRLRDSTPLWNNLITMAGMFLAIVALLGLLTFGLFHVVAPVANPYVDIVGYMVVPGILLLGLIAMPLGILLRSWRLHRRNPEQKLIFRFPRIDLADPSQRRAANVVVGGTFILLPVVSVSSYHGYHFTDSAMFCSQVCHAVMEPEATTYAQSGHARVPCAECHIGSGANWFVKSKLSGTRQVLAVLRDSYSRPIPPAIKHLRPARETCEECHWPEKFFGAQLRDLTRFASDENNTRHEIKMLLKTGGGARAADHIEGIHEHVALAGRIEYVAVDDKLQEIPWVKMTDSDGSERIYRSDGQPHSASKPDGRTRHMDCMDCHNRSAHRFLAPADAVDIALDERTLDSTLPFVKREAVAA